MARRGDQPPEDPAVPLPESGECSADGDWDVTVKLPPPEPGTSGSGGAAANRGAGVDPALGWSSTWLISSLFGRKRRNLDREIEAEETVHDSKADGPAASGAGRLSDVHAGYEIRNVFAEGGQGVISLAVDTALKRKVALKSLRPELNDNPAARENFVSEALVTASLEHPAVIPIYSLNTDDRNGLHLAMKLLRGRSLKEYLDKVCARYQSAGAAAFDEEESLFYRLDIFLRVCDAMDYVHSRGVVHCDLKPENIMVGEFREVYVMDWGIARRMDEQSGEPRKKVMGTPRFTSPENLLGLKCDARSDIYTLGLILFELVALRQAFTGQSVTEVVRKVRQHQMEPLVHRFGLRIPRDLAAIIAKATANDPAGRYQTVKALADDIRSFMRGSEVTANPDNFFTRIRRWCRRHRRIVLTAALLSVVLAVSLVAIGFFVDVARRAVLERQRDAVVAAVYGQAFALSSEIDRQFSYLSTQLAVLNSDIALLLANRLESDGDLSRFVPLDRLAAVTARDGGVKMPFAEAELNLDRIAYLTPDGRVTPEQLGELRRLVPLYNRLRLTVFRSLRNERYLDAAAGRRAYAEQRLPVRFAYFTLTDGLHLDFPGNTDYPPAYDGRLRPWYLEAGRKPDRAIWGMPYADSGAGGEATLTCSMAIIGSDHRFYGVAALDVPLAVLVNLMREYKAAEAPATISRRLINSDGRILIEVRGTPSGFKVVTPAAGRTAGSAMEFPSFPDPALLQRMKLIRSGKVFTSRDGREFLHVFVHLPSTGWFYVEETDFSGRMAANRRPIQQYLENPDHSVGTVSASLEH